MNDRLTGLSDIYTNNSKIYEIFSQAEDFPNKIFDFLAPKIKDKIVLDFGCGTGRFISIFSPLTKEYIATDIHDSQILIAKEKTKNLSNVKILKSSSNRLPLDDNSVDTIFSSWVISSIPNLKLREIILEELRRVLKPGGDMYFVENNTGGEYKDIVEGEKGNEKTKIKFEWFEKQGFWSVFETETYFQFENLEIAQSTFQRIWDISISQKVKKSTIGHNITILKYTPNQVLDTTRYVIDNSSHVKINHNRIKDFVNNFTLESESNWLADLPFDVQGFDDEQKLMFCLVFNALSFSYWGDLYWNVTYKGVTHVRGSLSLVAAIFRSIEEGKNLLDPNVIVNITLNELSYILRGNTEIPLLKERLDILNQIGSVLVGDYGGKFSTFVTKANKDALILLQNILKVFTPSFNDDYTYKGKKIFFNKRAQALIESIHSIFKGQGFGELKGFENLTALADYIIPNMLRGIKILEYSPELSLIIDQEIAIKKGSDYEIEIRACTIWVVEYIRRELYKRNIIVTPKSVNDFLWIQGGGIKTPFHKTRTIAY